MTLSKNVPMSLATAHLRSVCTLFPYRGRKDEPSLMADGKLIGACMRQIVQDKCNVIGIEVISMELMEVAYSHEVAQALLQV